MTSHLEDQINDIEDEMFARKKRIIEIKDELNKTGEWRVLKRAKLLREFAELVALDAPR